MQTEITGTVKWFNEEKGYGFIAGDGRDYFVHYRQIQKDGKKTLQNGSIVVFTPSKTDKGYTAIGVREKRL